jgi:hypothetical protein
VTESEDLRAFIRDLMARFDRGMDTVLKRLDEDAARRAERERESIRYFKAIRTEQLADRDRLDDILAENRAQRAALFRILDRLDNGGPATEPG